MPVHRRFATNGRAVVAQRRTSSARLSSLSTVFGSVRQLRPAAATTTLDRCVAKVTLIA